MEAEEEKIVEHAKEAIHALTDKKKNWKEKIGGFLWEILIIIIAVNLTIWFHSWSDKRHEQALVKEFLIDTRKSMVNDTIGIRAYINFMTNVPLVYYDSVLSQINNKKIDAHYIDSHIMTLTQNTGILFNFSTYQGFSSANNFRLIKNYSLSHSLIALYTEIYPQYKVIWQQLDDRRRDAFDKYIAIKTGYYNNGKVKLSSIINQPEVIYVFQMGDFRIKNSNESFEELIGIINYYITLIDKELKDRFDYIEKQDKTAP